MVVIAEVAVVGILELSTPSLPRTSYSDNDNDNDNDNDDDEEEEEDSRDSSSRRRRSISISSITNTILCILKEEVQRQQ